MEGATGKTFLIAARGVLFLRGAVNRSTRVLAVTDKLTLLNLYQGVDTARQLYFYKLRQSLEPVVVIRTNLAFHLVDEIFLNCHHEGREDKECTKI